MVTKDLSNLSAAVEEIVKAACVYSESTLANESLDSLKSSLDSKLNTINQSIATLKTELKELNSTISKSQKLEWAISNAHLRSFTSFRNGFG